MKLPVTFLASWLLKYKHFRLMWRCGLMLLWVIRGRSFLEKIYCRCVLTSSALLLNLHFFGRILETDTLLGSVLTDLASWIISLAISFGSLSLNKSFVPTWIIISTGNFSWVCFCNGSYLQFLPQKSVWQQSVFDVSQSVMVII